MTPSNYHLWGISPSFIRAGFGQLLIELVGVHLCIDHIIARGLHSDNNEQFSFILLLFSLLLQTKWIAKAGTYQQCFYALFRIQECMYWVFAHIFKLFSWFSLGDGVSHVYPFSKPYWKSTDAHSEFNIAWMLESSSGSSWVYIQYTCVVWSAS